jgi:hypothetical protein
MPREKRRIAARDPSHEQPIMSSLPSESLAPLCYTADNVARLAGPAGRDPGRDRGDDQGGAALIAAACHAAAVDGMAQRSYAPCRTKPAHPAEARAKD